MKSLVPLTAALLLCACQATPQQAVQLPPQPLFLHFDQPATYFEEALPLGNGRLGAMVYGGTIQERISLNDITLWTGEPEQPVQEDRTPVLAQVREALETEDYRRADKLQRGLQGHYSQNYQPLGTLWLRFPSDSISDYHRELNIGDATARISYRRNGQAFTEEYFVSAPDSALVIRITAEAPIEARIGLESLLPIEISVSDGELCADGYAAYYSYPTYVKVAEHFLYDPGRGIHFRTVVRCPQAVAEDGQLTLSGVREALLVVTNQTSFNGFDALPDLPYQERSQRQAASALDKGWELLKEAHTKDYRGFFDRVQISLGQTADSIKALPTDRQLLRYADGEANPELEALYFQYGRYLLISSSRTPGVPANLQGLWNESIRPPWSSNYTTNINLEENYWAAETTALPEMHESLLGFLHQTAVNGEATARDYYGAGGWCLGHNSDIWAMTCPVGMGEGDPCWANWNMGGAWLATHLWEHWLFTRDREALERDYPVLKGAAVFCMDFLVEKDGELITSPSTSPENQYVTPRGYVGETAYGTTSDLAIIRECLTDAQEAANELGDNDFARQIGEVLPRLRGYHIGARGNLQEWYHDWADDDPHHRHQSHLIGVYPGHQIAAGSPMGAAALKTLEERGFKTTGWSCGWRVNLYARLGDGENAYRMYRRLLRYVSPDRYKGRDARRGGGTYPNLLDAHSPFQIDGNFGGCAGVAEMLLQSTADGITPLPALPSAWPEGYVKGLRTRTGECVDLSWKDGEVTEFNVYNRPE